METLTQSQPGGPGEILVVRKIYRPLLGLMGLLLSGVIGWGCGALQLDTAEDPLFPSLTIDLIARLELPPTVKSEWYDSPGLKTSVKVSGFKVEARALNHIIREGETDSAGLVSLVGLPYRSDYLLSFRHGRIEVNYRLDPLPAGGGRLEIKADKIGNGRALAVKAAEAAGISLHPSEVLEADCTKLVEKWEQLLAGKIEPIFANDRESFNDILGEEAKQIAVAIRDRRSAAEKSPSSLSAAEKFGLDRNGDGNPDSGTRYSPLKGKGAFGQEITYYDLTPGFLVGGRTLTHYPQKVYKMLRGDGGQSGAFIFTRVPGESGYNDLCRVFEIVAPASYRENQFTTAREVEGSGLEIRPTSKVMNLPLLAEGSELVADPQGRTLESGWYEGKRVFYFSFESTSVDEATGMVALINKGYYPDPDVAHSQQKVIFRYFPPLSGYGELVSFDYFATSTLAMRVSDLFRRFDDIDFPALGVTLTENGAIGNCPILKVENENSAPATISRAALFVQDFGYHSDGNAVGYYDFGVATLSPPYLYKFYDGSGNALANKPIFTKLPGETGYDDHMRLVKVTLSTVEHSDSIKSLKDVQALGLTYATTTLIVNHVVVPDGAVLRDDPANRPLKYGWRNNLKVPYFEFESTTLSGSSPVTSPWMAIASASVASGQREIFHGLPQDSGYSDQKTKFVAVLTSSDLVRDLLEIATTRAPVNGGYTATGKATTITSTTDRRNLPIVWSAPSLSRIQSEIFTPTCATSGCHDKSSRAGSLDLSPGASYGELEGVPASQNPEMKRVRAEFPGKSYLLEKLRGSGLSGSRMPPSGGPLSSAQLKMVEDWILNGALNL